MRREWWQGGDHLVVQSRRRVDEVLGRLLILRLLEHEKRGAAALLALLPELAKSTSHDRSGSRVRQSSSSAESAWRTSVRAIVSNVTMVMCAGATAANARRTPDATWAGEAPRTVDRRA